METVFTNAQVVTPERCFAGSVVVRDRLIAEVSEKQSATAGAIDCEGDYLVPGFVELHTDNLEKHFQPRPGVRWPSQAAVVAHDAQIAAAGITTVFDALALGDIFRGSSRVEGLGEMRAGIAAAGKAGVLRAEHRLHLRCEVTYDQVVEAFDRLADDPSVGLVSLMDHTPGQRQFVDVEKYRFFYMKKYEMSEAEFSAFMADRQEAQLRHGARHRAELLARCQARGFTLASHDDATREHVAESAAGGMTIAEFPTTIEAAAASREAGLKVLMGAPNVVMGGSHSGNVAAGDLAARGMLDILSSDYVPMSLPQAAFALTEAGIGIELPAAIRLVSLNPAQAAGLKDRGAIAAGLRADVSRIAVSGGQPVVRSVWREGQRVV